jgi:hypothetical protein
VLITDSSENGHAQKKGTGKFPYEISASVRFVQIQSQVVTRFVDSLEPYFKTVVVFQIHFAGIAD